MFTENVLSNIFKKWITRSGCALGYPFYKGGGEAGERCRKEKGVGGRLVEDVGNVQGCDATGVEPVSIAGYQKIFTTAGISIADVWLMENNVSICPLCGRELAEPANKHHLIPVSKGGKNTPTIVLHKICHDKIHAVFTENELKRQYNSISQLQQQEEIAIFIKWVRKKEPAFYDKSVKTRSRRLK